MAGQSLHQGMVLIIPFERAQFFDMVVLRAQLANIQRLYLIQALESNNVSEENMN